MEWKGVEDVQLFIGNANYGVESIVGDPGDWAKLPHYASFVYEMTVINSDYKTKNVDYQTNYSELWPVAHCSLTDTVLCQVYVTIVYTKTVSLCFLCPLFVFMFFRIFMFSDLVRFVNSVKVITNSRRINCNTV